MLRRIFLASVLVAAAATASFAEERILVQSTTSTQNSGLYDYLLPIFTAETGIRVDVVAVGTGQALRNAENGDGDMLIVHARADEEAFVAKGFGQDRHDLMYNDFVFIGPDSDPADLAHAGSVSDAMKRILDTGSTFVSRGDDSGTHKKELALWADAGLSPSGAWYRSIGSGMGATLRMAIEVQGYTLTDRATWIAIEGKRDAKILYENDPPLFNQYGVIIVNPARHGHVNIAAATKFQDWLLGDRGQAAIAGFQVNGQQLFFPNAKGQ